MGREFYESTRQVIHDRVANTILVMSPREEHEWSRAMHGHPAYKAILHAEANAVAATHGGGTKEEIYQAMRAWSGAAVALWEVGLQTYADMRPAWDERNEREQAEDRAELESEKHQRANAG